MKVNELETILSIPRASIRFYEKEGLLSPERNDNGYREYDSDDLNRLKMIIVLRKMGMSIENIRLLLSGNTTLNDAVTDSISDIKKQLVELNGALSLCNELISSNVSLDEFDANSYFDKISEAEIKGASFASIAGDLIDYEIGSLGFEDIAEADQPVSKKLKQVLTRIGIVTVLYGIVWGWIFGQGLSSIYTPITLYVISIVIFAVVFLVKRKNERAGIILSQIIMYLCIFFLVFIVGAVIVLLLNSRFHFLF